MMANYQYKLLNQCFLKFTLTRALTPQQELTTDGRNLGKKDIFKKVKKQE